MKQNDKNAVQIRKIKENEMQAALALAEDVFMQFEAPDYGEEGVKTFLRTGIKDEQYVAGLTVYGAFAGEELVGIIAARSEGKHIALFFVKGEYHRHGIGGALFRYFLVNSTAGEITVNSSPFAREVYHHLGFTDTAEEQEAGGVRFIPMVFRRDTASIPFMMEQLESKDTSAGYKNLQELERISDETGLLYQYTDKFVQMINDDKYVIRVRGFRLFCKQAKWDADRKLDENIKIAMKILNDAKPTAVRQALASLHEVIQYKPMLREKIYKAALAIDIMKYKESMQSLIEKDIQSLLTEKERTGYCGV